VLAEGNSEVVVTGATGSGDVTGATGFGELTGATAFGELTGADASVGVGVAVGVGPAEEDGDAEADGDAKADDVAGGLEPPLRGVNTTSTQYWLLCQLRDGNFDVDPYW